MEAALRRVVDGSREERMEERAEEGCDGVCGEGGHECRERRRIASCEIFPRTYFFLGGS